MNIKMDYLWIVCYFLISLPMNEAKEIKIGALLHDVTQYQAFDLAIKYVNKNQQILPNVTLKGVGEPSEKTLTQFQLVNKAYDLAKQDIVAMIGPNSIAGVKATYFINEERNLPQVSPMATEPSLSANPDRYEFLLKMSTSDVRKSQAIMSLITSYGWTHFSIICEGSDFGRSAVAGLMTMPLKPNLQVIGIDFFVPKPNANNIDITKSLQNIKSYGSRVIVLQCHSMYTEKVLLEAYRNGMMDAGWVWIISLTDVIKESLYNPRFGVPMYLKGLIGLKPVATVGTLYYDFLGSWTKLNPQLSHGPVHTLIFDAVLSLAYGLHDYIESGHNLVPPPYDNSSLTTWEQGRDLIEYLSKVSGPGAAHSIGFYEDKTPKFIEYDIINLKQNGWKKIGHWTEDKIYLESANYITFLGESVVIPQSRVFNLSDRTLNIVTIISEPFVMETTERERAINPHVLYKGFCIDMLKELQDILGFKSELYMVPDGKFGSMDSNTGQWDGLMKETIEKRADLALAPLTINRERQLFVEFAESYYNLGLIIVMAKKTAEASLFAFLDPFNIRLWLCLALSWLVYGIVTSWTSALSPYGWKGRYAQRRNKEDTKGEDTQDVLNIFDNLWYSIAIWQQQGAEYVPISFSGRLVAFCWFFAVAVFTATYTANLAAFLTVQRLDISIDSINDLAKQTEVKYGILKSSAVSQYFSRQNDEPFRQMYNFMETENLMVETEKEGFDRVVESHSKGENYAFIHDSAIIRYKSNQEPCNLIPVGLAFHQIGYGIAFPKNSPIIEAFNLELLRLKDTGVLDNLKDKWIMSGTCTEVVQESSSVEVDQQTVTSMRGVFYFLMIGLLLGTICLIIEFFWASFMEAKLSLKEDEKTSFKEAIQRRFTAICDDISFKYTCFCCNAMEDSIEHDHHGNNKDDLATMSQCQGCGYPAQCIIDRCIEDDSD